MEITAGIFNTKQTPVAKEVIYALKDGIISSGDNAVLRSCRRLDHYPVSFKKSSVQKVMENVKEIDVIIQICEGGGCRNLLRSASKMLNKRRIIVDAGFFNSARRSTKNTYHSIGYDHIKGAADYCNKNSPPDRWSQLGLEMKDWRKTGDHVLLIGQNEIGGGMKHIRYNMKRDIFRRIITKIRKYTDRPIVFRTHKHRQYQYEDIFNNPKIKNVKRSDMMGSKKNTIDKDLKDAWCTVSLTSNAAVDSIFHGIPVITADKISPSYDVAEHDLASIENPKMGDRTQWAYDLAYAQWNLEEMKLGMPWKHLRNSFSAEGIDTGDPVNNDLWALRGAML
jgi:hypothetical protein